MRNFDMEALVNDIHSLLKHKFPNGNISVSSNRVLTESISVFVGLVGNVKELTGGIVGNDPLGARFTIFPDPKGFVVEAQLSNLSVEPEEGSYMAMGSVKIPFRKVRGDASKVLKAFERWSDSVIDIVKKEEQNIYKRNQYSDKYFMF